MTAFNVPGEPLPRQAKDEASDNDVAEGTVHAARQAPAPLVDTLTNPLSIA